MCRPYLRNDSLSSVAVATHQNPMMNPFIMDPKSINSLYQVQVKQNTFQLQISLTVVDAPMKKNHLAPVLPLYRQPEPEESAGITAMMILPCVQDHDLNGLTSTIFPSPDDGAQFYQTEDDLKDRNTDSTEEVEEENYYVENQREDYDGKIKNEDYYVEIKKGDVLDRGPTTTSRGRLPLTWHGYLCYDNLSRIHYTAGLNHDPGQACASPSDTSDYPNNSSSSNLDHLLGISFLASSGDQGNPNQKNYHIPRKNTHDLGGDELDRNDLDILDGFLNEESQLLHYPTVPEFSPTGVMDANLAHEEVLRFQARSILRAQENVLDPVSTPPDTSTNADAWNFFFDLFRMFDFQSMSPQLKEEIEHIRRRTIQQQPHLQYHSSMMMHLPSYNIALKQNMMDSMNLKYHFPRPNMPMSSAPMTSASSSTCSSPAPSCASSSSSQPAGGFYDIFHTASAASTPSSSSSSSTMMASPTPSASKKKNRRLCQHPGCVKRSRSHGLCITHGGGKRCQISGCNKSSQGGDLCIRHGGGKRCEIPNCAKAAQTNGKCKTHGGGPRCKIDGCDLSSQGNGLCRSHGGGRRCAYMGCTKGTQRGKYCAIHGGSKLCSIDGCHRNDRGGGFCANHGGGRRCAIAGCKKPSRRQGRCSEHLRLATTTTTSTPIPFTLQNSTDA